jgi:hypothetical protein
MDSKLEQFVEQKYLNLETYKKDKTPVQTPVWFIIENGQMYITTKETTGKVKRLRNNQNGRIAICSMKGDIKGDWINVGLQRIYEDNDIEKIVKLRKKKYGFSARLVGVFHQMKKAKTIAYSIEFLDR